MSKTKLSSISVSSAHKVKRSVSCKTVKNLNQILRCLDTLADGKNKPQRFHGNAIILQKKMKKSKEIKEA